MDDLELKNDLKVVYDEILRPEALKDNYAVIGPRIAGGAYGGVWPLKRRKDKKLMIGKRIEEQEGFGLERVQQEIAIMVMHKGEFLIECYDSLQYTPQPKEGNQNPKEERWMMLEPMSGDFQTVIDHCFETKRFLPEKFISYVCYCAIHGIKFLHHYKTIHRDIKSDNLLYNNKGEIKLADFGVSVRLTANRKSRREIQGTPLFMAPELCQEDKEYGLPVDIWSFGVMCVELANLKRPLSDVDPYPTTPEEILKLISTKGPPKLSKD